MGFDLSVSSPVCLTAAMHVLLQMKVPTDDLDSMNCAGSLIFGSAYILSPKKWLTKMLIDWVNVQYTLICTSDILHTINTGFIHDMACRFISHLSY